MVGVADELTLGIIIGFKSECVCVCEYTELHQYIERGGILGCIAPSHNELVDSNN